MEQNATRFETGWGVRLGAVALGFALVAGCSGLKTRSGDDSEAPAPEDSPAAISKASTVKPVFPVINFKLWPRSEFSKTGVIFAWTLTGSTRLVSDAGCRLRVRHRESGDTLLLKIDPKVPVSVQSLKPGTWDAQRLGCGLTRVWDLEDLFRDGFTVKANSVSVIGWFLFEFDDRTLVTVREGGREENTRLAGQLRSVWPAGAASLVSGFSGKPLPATIDIRDEIVRVKSVGLADSDEVLKPLLARFQSCAGVGMKLDPLRAGTLRMSVKYKAGVYDGVKSSSAEHALRDDLVQCLVGAHETFTVPPPSGASGDFTLETTY